MYPEPLVAASFFPVQNGSFSDLLFPLGVVAVVVLGVLFALVRVAMIQGTGQSDGPSPDELTNCPECGARTPVDDGTCHYCDEPLPDPAD